MASDPHTVEFIVEHMSLVAPSARSRPMFGEHAIYCEDRVVALVCDNRLFVKMTPGTSEIVRDQTETAPPYPGAKECYVIDEALWRDAEYLGSLATRAAADLPKPKPRKKKRT